jgi:CBS domain-containing protein
MGKIANHVSRELAALDAGATCREAAALMRDKRIGAVAVREKGKIVGLVTERDLVTRVVAEGQDAAAPIGPLVRRDLPAVSPQASEKECSDLLRDNYVRHLLVREGKDVVGLISMRDVIRLMLDEKEFLIEQLEHYIEGR